MRDIRDDSVRKVYTVLFQSHRYEWVGLDVQFECEGYKNG